MKKIKASTIIAVGLLYISTAYLTEDAVMSIAVIVGAIFIISAQFYSKNRLGLKSAILVGLFVGVGLTLAVLPIKLSVQREQSLFSIDWSSYMIGFIILGILSGITKYLFDKFNSSKR